MPLASPWMSEKVRVLKIVMDESRDEILLHLEGQLVGPWVSELERVCGPLVGRGIALTIDLSGVSFVGRDGLRLLAELSRGDVTLLHPSGFVSEQLRAQGM